MTTQDLINRHCHPGTKMSGKKISISVVVDMPLSTFFFIMQRLDGNQGPHQESWSHMLYSMEAVAPTVYNWVEALITVFKDQLTKCRQGELKQFGFGSILACFFFERVPLMRPQSIFTELRDRDPCMLIWVKVVVRTSGGRAKVKFEASFFSWL